MGRRGPPLPQLRAADFGGGRVLHEVVDRRRTVAGQPRGEIGEADRDVGPHPGFGDGAARDRDVDEVGGDDAELGAQSILLVGTAEDRVEDLARDRHEVRMRDPGPVEAVADSRSLSSRTLSRARSLTSGSRRDGMNAAMPPMAWAPRRWQVWTSSSV